MLTPQRERTDTATLTFRLAPGWKSLAEQVRLLRAACPAVYGLCVVEEEPKDEQVTK